jgi:uncharacterized protein (TIGR02646 family)
LKKITKGKEPLSLTAYRSSISTANMQKSNIYEDYKENATLRKQLLEEQGYVCCYCMSRISEKKSKIEHFKAQSLFRVLQIDYSNLFVACKGGEGTKEHYCDTLKGNKPLNTINLALKIESDLKYTKQGKISSVISTETKMSSLTKEMNDVLNLNSTILVKNRKQTYEDFKNNSKGKWTIAHLQKAIAYYKNKNNSKYEPYCEMMVYLLTQKLKAKK